MTVSHVRTYIPTKWETSCKISFPSYNKIHAVQILSFEIILWEQVSYVQGYVIGW